MKFFYFLIILLIVLLVYTIISTIIKLSLYLTTRTKYENDRLFLPTLFTFIVWSITIPCCLLTLKHFLGKSVLSVILDHVLKLKSMNDKLHIIIIVPIIYFIVAIIIQALAYFSVNIDLKKIWSHIRYAIKKWLKILPKDNTIETKNTVNIVETTQDTTTPTDNVEQDSSTALVVTDIPEPTQINNDLILDEQTEHLTFPISVVASLFSICLISFVSFILFFIGTILANKIL